MKRDKFQKNTVGFYSLGCAKNLADSEVMLGLLIKEGFQVVDPVAGCEIIIVNTCGFIDDAKEESIETILEAVALKKKKKCRFIVVCGCLSQRYAHQLYDLIPEVDNIIGTSQIEQIGWICRNLPERSTPRIEEPVKLYPHAEFPKIHISPAHYAFLKVAEGCDNNCAYCIIPQVRGHMRSRQIEDIMHEAGFLDTIGVKEVNIIAQDLTLYGSDLSEDVSLIRLLEGLTEFPSFSWLRLLYMHPYRISNELLEFMRDEPKVVPYLDIPIQHVDTTILKKMGRKQKTTFFYQLIERIRKHIPEISIRSTVMVGFPGETNEQFNALFAFLTEAEFDHLGVFRYSREPGTRAALMKFHVPDELKHEREKTILEKQAEISRKRLNRHRDQQLRVMIEDQLTKEGKDLQILARAPFQAPEVDGVVFIRGCPDNVKAGDFLDVVVRDTGHYDLYAEAVSQSVDKPVMPVVRNSERGEQWL